MEMSDQEKIDIKNTINGKISGNYDELETLLKNLTTEKEAATDHGRFKRIDKAINKVRTKMNVLKA